MRRLLLPLGLLLLWALFYLGKAPSAPDRPAAREAVASPTPPAAGTPPASPPSRAAAAPASAPAEVPGEPAATGHDWAALRRLFDQPPTKVLRPEGAPAAEAYALNGRGRTVAAARRLPDGRLVTGCFENFETLERFLRTAEDQDSTPASRPHAEQ